MYKKHRKIYFSQGRIGVFVSRVFNFISPLWPFQTIYGGQPQSSTLEVIDTGHDIKTMIIL